MIIAMFSFVAASAGLGVVPSLHAAGLGVVPLVPRPVGICVLYRD